MNNEDVQQLVEQLSIQYFGKVFRHRAYFNSRLRTTGGRYMLDTHAIELNTQSYNMHGEEELRGIILHELCHYHLHLERKGYRHRDADFKALLQQVGAPRFCKRTTEASAKKHQKRTYTYCCKQCAMRYERYRRINISTHVCGKCRGELIEIKLSKR